MDEIRPARGGSRGPARAVASIALAACVVACLREAPPPAAPSPAPTATASAPGTSATSVTAPATPATTGVPAATPATATTDGDGDGVADRQDECPYEPAGPHARPVDRGCPRYVRLVPGRIALLSPIVFEIDKAPIRVESLPIVDEIANVLSGHPEISLEIQGHGPSDPHRSMSITQKRAESVRDALVKRGIDARRLVARGYGDSVPLARPDSEEGKRLNRRLELRILPPPVPGP